MSRSNTILFPELTVDQRTAVEMIANQQDYTAIAKEVGKTTRTIYRWRQNVHFKRALAHLMQVKTDEIYASASNAMKDSIDILQSISQDEAKRASDRINAIKVLVDIWSKNRDYLSDEITDELAERVERLEEVLTQHGSA